MQFNFVLWNVFLQIMGHLATLITLECYRIYFVLSLPPLSAIMENSPHCINCFTIDESNQVKISPGNHAVPGLSFKNCSGDEGEPKQQEVLMIE